MEQLIAQRADYWASSYNAGLLEALAGNADPAFEHFRRAKELDSEGSPPRSSARTAASTRSATTRASRSCSREPGARRRARCDRHAGGLRLAAGAKTLPDQG